MMRHVLAAAVMMAQPFPGGGSSSGTAPVSPSVMATELIAVDASGHGTLQFLVLWRGTPGWFIRGGGGSSSGGGGSMGSGSAMMHSEWISQGGVNLALRFDATARKMWIQEKGIVLDDANVVLVDAVDSPAGPQVVRMVRIDPEFETTMEPPPYAMPGRGPQMRPRPMPPQTFIRRSPELIEFLQCDAPLAGLKPYEQQMFDSMCAYVKQP
ncbi:MAG TPA: hypothetical protein VM115_05790 [Vicinamibacterales bacterium]|nr:hypothetical protein [Vicinamibacterales bacterium]